MGERVCFFVRGKGKVEEQASRGPDLATPSVSVRCWPTSRASGVRPAWWADPRKSQRLLSDLEITKFGTDRNCILWSESKCWLKKNGEFCVNVVTETKILSSLKG